MKKINRNNFKSCLEALSRPGQFQPLLPLFDSGLLAMASVLLYAEVTHFYSGSLDFEMIRGLCGSSPASEADADYLFYDTPQIEHIQHVKSGTAENPELSATVVLGVEQQNFSMNKVALTGPGIKNSHNLSLPFTAPFIKSLMEKNENFPFGIDLFIAYPDNRLLGLPRTTKIEIIS